MAPPDYGLGVLKPKVTINLFCELGFLVVCCGDRSLASAACYSLETPDVVHPTVEVTSAYLSYPRAHMDH